jgi:acyl carrier protein
MNRDEIRTYLHDSIVEITDNEVPDFTDDTAPDDVAGWDSVNHIKLLFAVEAELNIGFEVSELTLPDTVGILLDLIQSKL